VPLDVYEARELAEMSSDMFGDRSGFAAARKAFVGKARPATTPSRLLPAARTEPPTAPRQLTRPRAADSAADTPVRVRSAVPLSA
jgi:putative two-component system hydrogenase maturation factor HypX/HoxX